MDNSQRAEMARQLNARFEPGEHEARSGGGGKWFVFLKRAAIIERLDSIAPMDWHTKIVSTERVADRVEVVMEMTITDITRSFNGVAEDNRRKAKDGKPEVLFPLMTAKSATTDAFKRVASMFGVGLYLQGCDTIQASNKADAFKAFERWYNSEGNNSQSPEPQPELEAYWNEKHIVGLLAYWSKEGLEVSETLRFAGITEKYNADQWSKYATNQDASAAIQSARQAELAQGEQSSPNGEMVGTFNFMNCIGKTSNMQFMMNTPGAKLNTIAVLYGGRGAIRKWGGDALYEQLGLSQYDKIKGKNITSEFIKMVAPIDFHFVSENRNGAEYFKITGIVGDPTIPF